jgi:methylenetetrahydrofolate reductase (NADPH)
MHELLYRRNPMFSFEFFPPKDEAEKKVLAASLEELAGLDPCFVSVTCGAAGSTRDLTRDLVCSFQEKYSFGVMAHVTATGYSRRELAELVKDYRRHGVMNFLALRGDPPRAGVNWTPPADQPDYALEVVKIIRDNAPGVSVGVAAYPETHPSAASPEADLQHLGEKVAAGADFAVTQMFFDNDHYVSFVERSRRAGIDVPILPGIMPITRIGQAERFETLCQVSVPTALRSALESGEKAGTTREIGVSFATAQATDLLRRGAPGIHFFTLNQSRACHTVFAALQAMGWKSNR